MHYKLACYGVLGDELEWFDQYLAGRKQMVCMCEAQSTCSDILQKLNLRMVHTNVGQNSTYFLGHRDGTPYQRIYERWRILDPLKLI